MKSKLVLPQIPLLPTFVFSLVLVTFSPVFAQKLDLDAQIPTYKALGHEDFVEHIRQAYALIETYSETGDEPIHFELSDFETRPIEVVKHEPYADLATLPNGWMLDLIRSFHSDWTESRRTLTYEYKWRHQETDWTAFPEGRLMLSLDTGEILAKLADEYPEYEHVRQATQYHVVVKYGDQQRGYDAAFLWISNTADQSWYAATFDHIVQGVDVVNAERVPPTGLPLGEIDSANPRPETIRPKSESPLKPGSATLDVLDQVDGEGTCVADSAQEALSKAHPLGTNGHISGHHKAAVNMDFACSCDESCTSRCEADIGSLTCEESSLAVTWDACHKMAMALDTSSQGRTNAVLEGARCAAGLACSQTSCLFCGCNLSTSVEVVGVTVEFAPTNAEWTGNLQGAWICGDCAEEQEAGDPDVGSGSGDEGIFQCSAPYICTSPILISMDDGTLSLTSPEDGVGFDIDGNGALEQISWTTPNSDDYFLALDHNTNGLIDNGMELFGQATHQQASADPNGFLALRWFDDPKRDGNGDLRITAADEVFHHLVLWNDINHDGISQGPELTPLSESGIQAIDLDYFISERRDHHGNRFRWASMVQFADGLRLGAMDVLFQTPDSQ